MMLVTAVKNKNTSGNKNVVKREALIQFSPADVTKREESELSKGRGGVGGTERRDRETFVFSIEGARGVTSNNTGEKRVPHDECS